MIEVALEAEVGERLGVAIMNAATTERRDPNGSRGYRNGVRVGRLKTSEGVIEYGVPQSDTSRAGSRRFGRR